MEHLFALAYRQMVADNTLDVAVLVVRRDWKPRPTPLAHRVLKARHDPAPTWLRQQLAGA